MTIANLHTRLRQALILEAQDVVHREIVIDWLYGGHSGENLAYHTNPIFQDWGIASRLGFFKPYLKAKGPAKFHFYSACDTNTLSFVNFAIVVRVDALYAKTTWPRTARVHIPGPPLYISICQLNSSTRGLYWMNYRFTYRVM